MENVKTYIADKVKEYMDQIDVLDKVLMDSFMETRNMLKTIADGKKEGKVDFGTAKPVLEEARQRDFQRHLMTQQLRDLSFRTRELVLIANLFNIELNLEEHQKQGVEILIEKGKPLFTVDKGELKMVDNELFDQIKKATGMSQNQGDLEKVYNEL